MSRKETQALRRITLKRHIRRILRNINSIYPDGMNDAYLLLDEWLINNPPVHARLELRTMFAHLCQLSALYDIMRQHEDDYRNNRSYWDEHQRRRHSIASDKAGAAYYEALASAIPVMHEVLIKL